MEGDQQDGKNGEKRGTDVTEEEWTGGELRG